MTDFWRLWVSHPDWSPLTAEENKRLEALITDGLFSDHTRREIDFRFDDSCATAIAAFRACAG